MEERGSVLGSSGRSSIPPLKTRWNDLTDVSAVIGDE